MGIALFLVVVHLLTAVANGLNCPAETNTIYYSKSNTRYRLGCDTDFTGSDLGWSAGTGLLDCIQQCETTQRCSAVVYGWNKACYFKGSDGQYKFSMGNEGAVLDSLIPGTILGRQPSEPTTCVVPPATNTQTPSPAKTLTFLAMGDSITMGYLEGQCYNSYRLAMINLLMGSMPLWANTQTPLSDAMYQEVHAVGSILSGNFTENVSEGFDGGEIDTIRSNWLARKQNYARTPDVATILAGIHDIADNSSDVNAVLVMQSMERLIDDLYRVYPRISVMVSTLTPVTVDGWTHAIAAFNAALPDMIRQRAESGQRILMVDSASALSPSVDLADFVHPNANGYRKIASLFYASVKTAVKKGWLP